MRTLVVIPARLASTRLPRKLLLAGPTGKPLIQHVWEQARRAARPTRVVVATDSEEIRAACADFGAEALLTREDHPSGTDRVAEAVRQLASTGEAPDLVVNVQGDEPELDPALVDRLIELMAGCDDPMGTLAEPIEDSDDLTRSQVVKVVLDVDGRALYFSRAAIPHGAHVSGGVPEEIGGGPDGSPRPLRHIGIYAYRPAFLQAFCGLAPAPLEQSERLEQLRALYHGHRLRVAVVPPQGARGIDTPEDYERFLARVGGASS